VNKINKTALLTEEAERIFGKIIGNTQDATEFADSIFKSTNKVISYNTVRRLYKIVKNDEWTPSKSTLNIIAEYCGFNSFSDFSTNFNIQNNQIEFYNECYLKFYKNQKVDFGIVNKICSQKQDFFTFDFLKKTIHIAFTYEDLDFLTHLFVLDSVFKNKSYLYFHQNYLIQDIGALLRKHKNLQNHLWTHWSLQQNARLLYFELFVDMDYLINNHYLAIEMYHKHSTTQQDLIFTHSLLFFRAFVKDNNSACLEHYQTLSSLDIKEMHPIPKARYFISKLLFSNPTSELIQEIKYWCEYEIKNKKTDPPYFHVWIMEGLIMVHQNDLVIQLWNIIKDDSNFQDNRINRGLIQRAITYSAFALIKTGQLEEGRKLYNEINPNEYNLFSCEYDSLFYSALTFHISKDKKVMKQGEEKAKVLGYDKLYHMLTDE
jgi:hypothetical protein